MTELIVKNEKELLDFGKKIAANLKSGDVLCLYGNLGVGKTTMTKGIAQYFGIKKRITSPTFTLFNVYKLSTENYKPDQPDFAKATPGKLNLSECPECKKKPKLLVHIDAYRVKDEEELLEVGMEDYLGDDETICVVEWAEKIPGLLKNKKCVEVHIEHTANGRKILY